MTERRDRSPMQESPSAPRRRGRPRSEPAHRALLEAALREFVARGYEAMSLEAIAAAAGVSKITLYRRWDSKLALVRELLESLSDETPMEDQGSLEEDLRVLLREAYRAGIASPAGQIMPRFVAEIASHPELLDLYRTVILPPRMARLRALIARARARDELREDLPFTILADLFGGPIFYHLTVLALVEPSTSDDVPELLTRAILRGIAKQET
jgi:AcrR family transcriptional regulator